MIDEAPSCDEVAELFDRIADVAGLPEPFLRTSVCLEALKDPELLELPARLATETSLAILLALGGFTEASFWIRGNSGGVRCLALAGAEEPSRRVRAAASAVLASTDGDRRRSRGRIQAVPVERWQRVQAALVVRSDDDRGGVGIALAREAAGTLGFLLERETLLERSAARERSLVESSERRLTRLAFDLHDGPVQDVVALAGDVRILRDRIRALVGGPSGTHALAVLGDLEARLVGLDGELRDLAHSLESTTMATTPLREAVEKQMRLFRQNVDIEASLDISGDFGETTASQRIALVRIVQEALANVRDHSGATRVRVVVSMRRGRIEAEIVDDGRGFDVEGTLVEAARNGRLGLVGMAERVRLLGGRFDIESRVGGPTSVSVVFPAWRPVAGDAAGADAVRATEAAG